MLDTEKKFVQLAKDYLKLAKKESIYGSERELFTDFVEAILDTLVEEEEKKEDGDPMD